MKVATGTVIDGKVVVEGDLPADGTKVTVVLREDEESFELMFSSRRLQRGGKRTGPLLPAPSAKMLRVRSHSFQLNLVSAFRRLARKQEASVGSRSAEFATISTIACRRKRWRFSRSGMQVAVGSLGCEVRSL